MTLPKKKSREIVLQLLYSQDFSSVDTPTAPDLLSESLEMPRASVRAAHKRALEIRDHLLEIDSLIQELSEEYTLDRIGRVERNILRLAAYELLYDNQVPPKVALSEAVRLARKYSTPESAKFVNGVLDTFYKEHLKGEDREEEDKMELYWRNEDSKE